MREAEAKDFLRASGWGDAELVKLPGDASTRNYARLTQGGRRALLMDQPQGAEAPLAGPHANEAERRALGYNALARLAGADTRRFQVVAEHLRVRGLAAPQIHAADHPSGFVLLEDFGDRLYADVLAGGADEAELYKAAADVLVKLHAEPAPDFLPPLPSLTRVPATASPPSMRSAQKGEADLAPGMPLYAYDKAALLAETDLLTEWFLPLALNRPASGSEHDEHRTLWGAALDKIVHANPVLVHRDFHAQNLLWMPEREGAARVGLIDFQDAVAGSRAYDLVSLLEDARRDVSPELAELATKHYLTAAGVADQARFRAEMAVMAAQRNAKIVGIFARLYRRDVKPRYLALLPRVWRHLEKDLSHPALADLRAWYDRTIPANRRVIRAEKETL